jgi:glycerol kinase
MEQDGGRAVSWLRVDGGPAANPYLMQALADLSGLEVRVAAAREATAVGIATLAGHSALGLRLAELAARWRAQATYTPVIGEDERGTRLGRWRRALAAAQVFHDN